MKSLNESMQSLPGGQATSARQSKAHAQAIIRGDIMPDSHTDASMVQENFTRIKDGIISRNQQILRQSAAASDAQLLMASGDDSMAVGHAGVIYSSGGFAPPPLAVPMQSTGTKEPGSGTFIDLEI